MSFKVDNQNSKSKYIGKSTDIKPVDNISPGSILVETDTGITYRFDGDTWFEDVTQSSSKLLQIIQVSPTKSGYITNTPANIRVIAVPRTIESYTSASIYYSSSLLANCVNDAILSTYEAPRALAVWTPWSHRYISYKYFEIVNTSYTAIALHAAAGNWSFEIYTL